MIIEEKGNFEKFNRNSHWILCVIKASIIHYPFIEIYCRKSFVEELKALRTHEGGLERKIKNQGLTFPLYRPCT